MSRMQNKFVGLKLLKSVKEELGIHLVEQEVSEKDLYLAAQQLIDISRSEYIEPEFKDRLDKPGYYSHAVDTAITKMQSSLWRNETIDWQDDDDPMRFHDKMDDLLTTRRRHLVVGRFDA